jgi:small subunit ribosomal protein S21
MRVEVRDGKVDKAMNVLKKKMLRDGMFNEMREREFFEKPSVKKRREKNEAIRRAKKKKKPDFE